MTTTAEAAAKRARQKWVMSVHDTWPTGRSELNSQMITVLDEICDMVDHYTGYGTFTVEHIVERTSIYPITADQARRALQ